MNGLGKTLKALVLVATLTVAGSVSAQVPPAEMQAAITSYNDFITRMKAPLGFTNGDEDILRIQRAQLDARDAAWLKYFPSHKEAIMGRLTQVLAAYQKAGGPDRPEITRLAGEVAGFCEQIHQELNRLNNGQEVLWESNRVAGAPAAPATTSGTSGTTAGPGTTAPANPAGTPVSGPGSTTPGMDGTLLGVGTNGPTGPAAPTSGTTTTATTTANASPSAGSPAAPGSTQGAVARAGSAQALTQVESLLQTLLSDENINNGAVIEAKANGNAVGFVPVPTMKTSLGEVATLLRSSAVARANSADAEAIVQAMFRITSTTYGWFPIAQANGYWGQAVNAVKAERNKIFEMVRALAAKQG